MTVDLVDDELRAVVEDNGRGFDIDEVMTRSAPSEHLGLAGIQERAAMAGGVAEIESSPGNGATLYIRVPGAQVRSKPIGPAS